MGSWVKDDFVGEPMDDNSTRRYGYPSGMPAGTDTRGFRTRQVKVWV